jgi:hypothetical protein
MIEDPDDIDYRMFMGINLLIIQLKILNYTHEELLNDVDHLADEFMEEDDTLLQDDDQFL